MNIRLQCDSRDAGNALLDERDRKSIVLWAGDDIDFEIALFVDGQIVTPYEVGTINVDLISGTGTVLASQEIPGSDVNTVFTLDDWQAGTASLVVASFDSTETESMPEGICYVVVTHRDLENEVTTHAKAKASVRSSDTDVSATAIVVDTVTAATNAADFEDLDITTSTSPTRASTVTTDQVVHPSVRYVPDGWNGYNYWLAITPYIGGNDQHENPSVMVSNDGRNWSEPGSLTGPDGVGNPIVYTPTDATDYNADTDLLIDDDETAYIYYIEVMVTTGTVSVKAVQSTDGLDWSTAPATLHSAPLVSGKAPFVSPSVVKFLGQYWMFAVDGTLSTNTLRVSRSSHPNSGFGSWVTCSITGLEGGYSPWHLEVRKVGNQLAMILNAGTGGGDSAVAGKNYILTSTDGFNWSASTAVLVPGTGGQWDDDRTYRASAHYDIDNRLIRIWYSAFDGSAWGMGYTESSWSDAITLAYAAGTPANQMRFINKSSALYHVYIPDAHGFSVGHWFEAYARTSPIAVHLAEPEDIVTTLGVMRSVYLEPGQVCRWTYTAANEWQVTKAYGVVDLPDSLKALLSFWYSWDDVELDGSQNITQVNDRSGNGLHLVAASGEELLYNTIAGLSIPSLGTSNGTPKRTAKFSGTLPSEISGEIWIVAQGVSNGLGITASKNGDATPYMSLSYATSGGQNNAMRVVSNPGSGADIVHGSDDVITSSPINVLRYCSDGAAYTMSHYVDWVAYQQELTASSGDNEGTWWGDITAGDTLALGALIIGSTSYYASTRFYEIIDFNRELTDSEAALLIEYLQKRFDP